MKMQAIADAVEIELEGLVPYLRVKCSDSIMSSVTISGSFDDPENWENNIFENSRHFRFSIMPMDNKRYYSPDDPKVTVELIQKCFKIEGRFRKYTGPPDKVLSKIRKWIEDNK